MSAAGFTIRRAAFADIPALQELIATSARALSRDDYTPAQIEGALRGAFGVDTQLIRDGSYFVIEVGDRLAGCGGWSRRRTLVWQRCARRSRRHRARSRTRTPPKIRAFFIHPDFARRGLGNALLERCEHDAIAHGFPALRADGDAAGRAAVRGARLSRHCSHRMAAGRGPLDPLPAHEQAGPAVSRIASSARAWRTRAAILALQKLAYESEARLYDDWKLPPLTQTLDSLQAEFASTLRAQGARRRPAGRFGARA